MTFLDFALFYKHYLGWSVIPLKERDKTPALKSWLPYQKRHATDAEIAKWFTNTNYNIGIICGQVSGGLVVIDLDTPEAVMWSIDQRFPLTLSVQTSKGTHLYYHSKDKVSNFQKRSDMPGVDLRGDGGYVAAPPSIHKSGKKYEWADNGFPVLGWELPDLPGIILSAPVLNYSLSTYHVSQAHSGVTKRDPIDIAMDGAPIGERNQALAVLAGSWIANGITESLSELVDFAETWSEGLEAPMDRKELIRTCRSIWDKDRKQRSRNAVDNMIQETLNSAPGPSDNLPPKDTQTADPDQPDPNSKLSETKKTLQGILDKMASHRAAKLHAAEEAAKPPELTASDVKLWLYNAPPPVKYIFKDILLRNTIGYIHSLGGVGKSFFLNSLMLSLVSGSDLWDIFEPVSKFKVMMFTAEDSATVIRQRLWGMSSSFNDNDRKIMQDGIDGNLMLYSGQPLPLLNLDNGNPITSKGFDALLGVIKDHRPDVLFLDPKSMFYGSLDENNNSHNTAFVTVLKNFVNEELDGTVLFTHHESKASGGQGLQTSSRGGQALSDGVRWQVSMSRMSEDDAKKFHLAGEEENYIRVDQTKSNYTKFFRTFYLKRGDFGVLDRIDLNETMIEDGLAVIKLVLRSGAKVRYWEIMRMEGTKFRKECRAFGMKKLGDIPKLIDAGLDSGELVKDAQGYVTEYDHLS